MVEQAHLQTPYVVRSKGRWRLTRPNMCITAIFGSGGFLAVGVISGARRPGTFLLAFQAQATSGHHLIALSER